MQRFFYLFGWVLIGALFVAQGTYELAKHVLVNFMTGGRAKNRVRALGSARHAQRRLGPGLLEILEELIKTKRIDPRRGLGTTVAFANAAKFTRVR